LPNSPKPKREDKENWSAKRPTLSGNRPQTIHPYGRPNRSKSGRKRALALAGNVVDGPSGLQVAGRAQIVGPVFRRQQNLVGTRHIVKELGGVIVGDFSRQLDW